MPRQAINEWIRHGGGNSGAVLVFDAAFRDPAKPTGWRKPSKWAISCTAAMSDEAVGNSIDLESCSAERGAC
jgi:hypothetical protein